MAFADPYADYTPDEAEFDDEPAPRPALRPVGELPVWIPEAADALSLSPPAPGQVPAWLVEGLNEPQRQAVECLDGPLMVVAGPGSGKTSVLTRRVAALLATGRAEPWEILAVTFTNKAAGEMRERIANLVGPACEQIWVATFHSACVRILRSHAEAAGLPRSFSIVDASDSKRLCASVLADLGWPTDPKDVRELQGTISTAKNLGLSPDGLWGTMGWAARPMAEYNARLEAMGAVDFDDILLRTLSLLSTHPEVAERYQAKFRHVLVDEYQDTNAVQYQITQILAAGHGNLCVVGDLDQSIYRWRGAVPEGMNGFNVDYPAATIIVLEQNYRSTQAILETVRALIAPNPSLHRPELFTENPLGEPVRLYVADDDRDEAAWVVREIRSSPDAYDAHAVLFRTNFQTRAFEEELTRQAVPYQVVGALRFYDRAEVKDALSYLRVAVNPADAISLARCINTPKRGIGDATVAGLIRAARAAGRDPITEVRTGLAAGTFAARAAAALEGFLAIYDQVAAACASGPAAALAVVADAAGMMAALKASKDGVDREENLVELVDSARSFVNGPSPTRPEVTNVCDLDGYEQTLAYLENVALVSAVDIDEAEGEGVTRVVLLTAHSAKGKEFPHVYVVGVEDGLFPHSRSKGDAPAVEEERRLLFVAASRAERTLSLSRCRRRLQFGKVAENDPSPFLDDLPDSVVRLCAPRALGAPGRPGYGGGYGANARPRPASGHRVANPAYAPPRPPAPGGFGGRASLAPAVPAPTVAPRLRPDQLGSGTQVDHPAFGPGVVVSVRGSTAEIAFGATTKVLELTMAPLSLA